MVGEGYTELELIVRGLLIEIIIIFRALNGEGRRRDGTRADSTYARSVFGFADTEAEALRCGQAERHHLSWLARIESPDTATLALGIPSYFGS